MQPSDIPDNPAVGFLARLIKRHERSRPGAKTQSLKVDFGDALSRDVELGERLLFAAESLGAITIERPRKASHLLGRIALADVGALALFLGHELASITADNVFNTIMPLIGKAPIWIQDEIEAALVKWSIGETAFGLAGNEIDRIADLIKILIAVDRGVDGRDIRTFSAEAGVGSKAFERHQGTLIQIFRRSFGLHDLSKDEVLDHLGFRPFFPLVCVAGPIAIPRMGLDVSEVLPFVGLPAEAVSEVELTEPILRILTIENLASFNRHTRVIRQAGTVVVYSGGFAARPVIAILKRLIGRAPTAKVHHWGDVDAGGIRIFRNLEERINREIHPHLMDQELVERLGRPAPAVASLSRIADQGSGIGRLAEYLASSQARHLEQELVSPCSVA